MNSSLLSALLVGWVSSLFCGTLALASARIAGAAHMAVMPNEALSRSASIAAIRRAARSR